MNRRTLGVVVLALLTAACGSAGAGGSSQAFHRSAGTIVFEKGFPGHVFTIAPDGTTLRQIRVGPCCPRIATNGSGRIVVTAFPHGMPTPATLTLDGSHFSVLAAADPTLKLTDPCAPSPDGTRIACEGGEGPNDAGGRAGIYTFRSSDGRGIVRVSGSPGRRAYPIAYSPDGSKILFLRQVQRGDHYDGPMTVFVVNTDGGGLTRLNPPGTTSSLIDTPVMMTASWSPDGRYVALVASEGSFSTDSPRGVFVVGADGSHPRRISPWGNSFGAEWSPDGRWIAFSSANPQAQELFVVHPDGSKLAAITSEARGAFSFGPAWSPDSARLLFARGTTDLEHTNLWTVNVDGTGARQLTHSPGPYESYSWVPSPKAGH